MYHSAPRSRLFDTRGSNWELPPVTVRLTFEYALTGAKDTSEGRVIVRLAPARSTTFDFTSYATLNDGSRLV